jgi:hypothetical protein
MRVLRVISRISRQKLMAIGLSAVSLGASACIPYTVGTTAQTVPMNEETVANTGYFLPNTFNAPGCGCYLPGAGMNIEIRRGLDDFNDLGVRIVPLAAGAIVNVKHRFGSDTSHTSRSLALISGVGLLELGMQLHVEATLIASGPENVDFSPYGGLRVTQVAQIATPTSVLEAADAPTAGIFAGISLGNRWATLRPEVGAFYTKFDPSVRQPGIIFVPSMTIQLRSERRDRPRHMNGSSADGP